VNLGPVETVIHGSNWRQDRLRSVARTWGLTLTSPNRHFLLDGSQKDLSSVNLGSIRPLKMVSRSHQEKRKYMEPRDDRLQSTQYRLLAPKSLETPPLAVDRMEPPGRENLILNDAGRNRTVSSTKPGPERQTLRTIDSRPRAASVQSSSKWSRSGSASMNDSSPE
jgi:hypothetical protein